MRVEEALDRFLMQLAANGRSRHTASQYRRHINLLARWARDVRPCGDALEAIDHEAVAQFLASTAATQRAGGGAKRATSANCLRSSIKCFFSYLYRAGYVQHDAGRLIRRAQCSPPPPRALSDADQQRLLEALEKAEGPEAKRDFMLFDLMLRSGIRIGSAVALDLEDLGLDKSEIRPRTSKNDAPDTIFLSQVVCDHLRRFIEGRSAGALFTSASGERVSIRHMQRRFSQWIGKAGIATNASPHSLRHAFAVRIYMKTRDLLLTKAALGHRSIGSTVLYARADPDRLRRAL